MITQAKNLLRGLRDLFPNPRCPNCKHDTNIHWDDRDHCLGAKFDERTGAHVAWCDCTGIKPVKKKEKAA
jgi:hypothetical protein